MEQELNSSYETLLNEELPVEERLNPVSEEPQIVDPTLLVEDNNNASEPEPPQTTEEEPTNEEESPIYTFLKERGIDDPSKIQFTNEDESVEELDFNSLSKEEQLEVLRMVTDPGLTEAEINTINYLRQNNATLEQVVDYFAQKRLDDYLKENPDKVHQKVYSIDEYTDDDLYIYDLKQRYPDFTDEELNNELEKAKEDEELFKRKTEIIRNTFKQQEDQAEQARIEQEQQQVEDLRNNLMNAAGRFNEIQLDYTDDESDSLIIDDADKTEMMSYILDQDSDGKSQLVKDLEDPDRLIELAWFATQGPKMMSELSKHWKKQLGEARAEIKKLQSQLDKKDNKTSTFVVPPTKTEEPKAYKSAWDNSGLI